MTRWPILNILQGLYIKAKLSKMADFVDEIEIDKIRNTSEIFPFMAKFVCFFMDSTNSFGLIAWKKPLQRSFLS